MPVANFSGLTINILDNDDRMNIGLFMHPIGRQAPCFLTCCIVLVVFHRPGGRLRKAKAPRVDRLHVGSLGETLAKAIVEISGGDGFAAFTEAILSHLGTLKINVGCLELDFLRIGLHVLKGQGSFISMQNYID